MVAVDDDHLARLGRRRREHDRGHPQREGKAELTHPQYNEHGGAGLREYPKNARVRPLRAKAPRSAGGAGFPILRRVRRLALLLLFVLGAFTLGSCGGDDDQTGVENLLDKAFSGEIHSADLKLEAEIELKGLLKDPIKIEAEGPFRTNQGKLPSADIELRIGSGNGGQTITSGVLTTGDRVFLKFQDVYYEQPAAQVRQANRALAQGKGSRPLGELGLDPRSWLAEAKDEGDAEVGGVDTNHVSGTLDVARLMRNLNVFVRRSAGALGVERGDAAAADREGHPGARRRRQEPQLRRLLGQAGQPDPPGLGQDRVRHPRGQPGRPGRPQGRLDHVLGRAAQRQRQPGDRGPDPLPPAVPADQLAGGRDRRARRGRRHGPGARARGGRSGSGTTSSDADQFRKYADCLDKARPEDTEQLQRCADLLQQP